MDRISIPRDRSQDVWKPSWGSWRPLRCEGGGRSASVACAACGKSATLTGHTIAASGEVSPSLQCPYGGCGWHVFVTLAGWQP